MSALVFGALAEGFGAMGEGMGEGEGMGKGMGAMQGQSNCVPVNHVNDNPGHVTCECVAPEASCTASLAMRARVHTAAMWRRTIWPWTWTLRGLLSGPGWIL